MERHRAIYPTERPTLDLSGTGTELEILDLLQRFDVLPSHYIYAWVGRAPVTRWRLTRLMRGHYIGLLQGKDKFGLSEDARLYARLRNVHYPLSIWPRGKALLAKRGLWIERERAGDQFDHKMFRSIVDWSFAFAAKQKRLTYETLGDIRMPPVEKPTHIPVPAMSDLVPDSFVKLEGKSNFFAHIEIDNNTETQFAAAENSIQGKVKRYAEYVRRRAFVTRYDLPKVTILFFFNKTGRVKTFLDVVKKTVPERDVQQRFAALYVPDFRESFPPPTGWALQPYERVGEPLNILEIVNAERKSAKNLRASGHHQEGRGGAGAANGGGPETRPTA